MKKAIVIGLVLFLMILPVVQSVCINDTFEGEFGFIGDSNLPTGRFCQYGCDSNRGKCNEPFNPTPQQSDFSLTLFIIVLVMAFGSLVIGILKKRITVTILAFVLFSILAFQSFSFDLVLSGTAFSGLSTIFIGISWLFALISFLATLVGMVGIIRAKSKRPQ
jgi:hypothetical protein